MAGTTGRESVTVAGRAERAWVVRTFVGGVLAPGHPCGDVAVLLADELFGNSVQYSRSGLPGQVVTVTVHGRNDVVRVEVADRSGPGVPRLRPLTVMRKAVEGLGWWRGWPRGGGGGGAASGR